MLVKITNFGGPRLFPTCVGNFFLGRLTPVRTENKRLVEELRNYNKRSDIFLEIKILEDDPPVDYSKYKIYELRSIAAKAGIEGFFTMRKPDLIKKLEEKNGN